MRKNEKEVALAGKSSSTKEEDVLLSVKVVPNAKENKICEKIIDSQNQEHLKISIKSAPENGKANEELVKFLAKSYKIPKSKIEIIRGHNLRFKLLKLPKNVFKHIF